MPGWNECSIYDDTCRMKTCSHPTNPRNQGVQCRTMLSQRPCGSSQCTREECSRATESAQAFMKIMDGTKDSTNIGSTGSESVSQSESGTESTYTLTGLSGRDVERLEQALRMLRRTYTRDSAGYRETSELGARVSALTWDK